jgi:hypothetical protein
MEDAMRKVFPAARLLVAVLLPIVGPWLTHCRADGPALPADLALVPADAVVFAAVRPADILAGEVGDSLRQLDERRFPIAEMMAQIASGGNPIPEMERVIEFLVPGAEPSYVLTATKPLDRARVLKGFGNHGKETKVRSLSHYRDAEAGSIVFVNDRTFLFGTADAVDRWLRKEPIPPRDGPLAVALCAAADNPHLTAAVTRAIFPNPEPLAKSLPPALASLAPPLLRAESALLTARFGKEFRLDLRCAFPDEEKAKAGEQALRAGRDLAVRHVPELGEILADDFVPFGGSRNARELLHFFEETGEALKSLPVERQGKTVAVQLRLPGRGAVWGVLMLCMPRAIAVSEEDGPPGPAEQPEEPMPPSPMTEGQTTRLREPIKQPGEHIPLGESPPTRK